MDLKKELYGVVNKTKSILLSPQKFYSELSEKGYKKAIVYVSVLSTFSTLILYFMRLLSDFGAVELVTVLFVPFAIVVAALSSFVYAGILHLWLRIFGSKKAYQKTFQIYVYSLAPMSLFFWIPYLNKYLFVWQIVLLGIGSMYQLGMTRRRVLIAFFALFAVFILISIASLFLMPASFLDLV